MKLVNQRQMQQIDKIAISHYGIPSVLLMEHAAYSVFLYMKEKELLEDVLILCGVGNNGGDGFALARQLYLWGKESVTVVFLSDEQHLSEDAKVYYTMCVSMGIPIVTYTSSGLTSLLKGTQVIVDALFGTGLSRAITGNEYKVIEEVNKSELKIISIDMPSGIDANTGQRLGIAIKADVTITFELPKVGQCIYPGINDVGELYVTHIGIPKQVLKETPACAYAIDKAYAKTLLPKRPTRSNKGTFGKVLMIGGQTGMSGAITLAVMSCLKSGAGTVTAAVPENIHDIMEQKVTEIMTLPMPSEEGHIGKEAIKVLSELFQKYDVIGIGPGIGRSEVIKQIIQELLKSEKPCVIDADGLYALKPYLKDAKNRKAPIVITPHPGEMAYLIEDNIPALLENALDKVCQFAKDYGIITVLKLERTLIADKEGTLYINTTGNSGLAKGGSGDVLTGMITSFLAQGMRPEEAAHLGVYIHGKTADYLADQESIYTLLPSRLIDNLHVAFKVLEN